MIVIDTSIWIEFFKNNTEYRTTVKNLLEGQKILAVECIFGELLQGAKNKREKDILFSYWENLPKCEREDIWIKAGIFSSENKLISKGIGLIDCVILLSAKNSNAKIWSLDKKVNSILKKDEKFTL